MSHSTVAIGPRGEERIRRGHPWIYRADVLEIDADGRRHRDGHRSQAASPRPGAYSDRSQIALRLLTRLDVEAGPDFWRTRLEAAIRFRDTLHVDATAVRLVHGEADLLPSLIVDRYGEWLVLQALSQATDRLLPTIVQLLVDITGPAGILARNDPRVRQLEGLEQKVEVLHGSVPERIEITESGLRFDVDPWHGQKTGLFLDQRENRVAAARYARGRLLDAFSYNGGFALTLASHLTRWWRSTSRPTRCRGSRENAQANGVQNVTARDANVFDELRHFERSGERFDTIVLDPPAFAKNKASVPNAIAGYKDINLRALRILRPGGTLITCSCSYNVDETLFFDILREAAADAHAAVSVVEKRTQGRDHPVLMGAPETYYLKCAILRKLE